MRRPKFSLKAMLWLVLVAAAYCAGRLHGRHEFDWDWQRNEDQHKKDLAHRDKILREVLAENLDFRSRLGLPLVPDETKLTPSE